MGPFGFNGFIMAYSQVKYWSQVICEGSDERLHNDVDMVTKISNDIGQIALQY